MSKSSKKVISGFSRADYINAGVHLAMEKQDLITEVLEKLSTEDMLTVISRRGGHPGAVAEAALLCLKKSEDYNSDQVQSDPHTINRDGYFPFGLKSHVQMLHTKVARLVSLAASEEHSGGPNFESVRDTCLDLINYSGFCADWLQRGQS